MQGSEQSIPQLDQGCPRWGHVIPVSVLIPPLHATLHKAELPRKEGNSGYVALLFKTLHCSEDTEQNSSPRTSCIQEDSSGSSSASPSPSSSASFKSAPPKCSAPPQLRVFAHLSFWPRRAPGLPPTLP